MEWQQATAARAGRSSPAGGGKPQTKDARFRAGALRSARTALKMILWGTIAVLVCLLGAALLPAYAGYHQATIYGGSMGDALPLGSVAVTRTIGAQDVRVGDVIAVGSGGAGPAVLHRVISLEESDAGPVAVTRGDANSAADPASHILSGRGDRVVYHIPRLGYVIHHSRTMPVSGILAGAVALAGVSYAIQRYRQRARCVTSPARGGVRPSGPPQPGNQRHPAPLGRLEAQHGPGSPVIASADARADARQGARRLPSRVARALARSHRVAAIALAFVLLGAPWLTPAASAVFADAATVESNAFTADTLNAPVGLGTSVSGASVTLNWTATADAYATGHRVFRSATSGSGYAQVAEVTPRTTTVYVNSPGAGTWYYVVRAYYQSWESANSNEASATVTTNTGFRDCSANAAVTTSSGDNNGFQTNPGNACSNNSAFAGDTNSGTNTATSCSGAGKDRHLFYDYGLSIPAGSTINGIEVRLDAWADATKGSPFMCVELSWNGGTSWTATKSTSTLTTTQETSTLGSATDNWGRTWTASEFSNANFRIRITDVASNTARDFRLDWAAVQVTYTPP